MGIAVVSFRPFRGREDLIWSLGVPDVRLVTLLPEMEGLVVPSRDYGMAAAERPMVNIDTYRNAWPNRAQAYLLAELQFNLVTCWAVRVRKDCLPQKQDLRAHIGRNCTALAPKLPGQAPRPPRYGPICWILW